MFHSTHSLALSLSPAERISRNASMNAGIAAFESTSPAPFTSSETPGAIRGLLHTQPRMAVSRRSAQAQSVRARVLHNRAPCAYVPSGDMVGSVVVHHTVARTAIKALRTIEFILSQRRIL